MGSQLALRSGIVPRNFQQFWKVKPYPFLQYVTCIGFPQLDQELSGTETQDSLLLSFPIPIWIALKSEPLTTSSSE